ncbi:Branched-chain amino acid transport, AzlC [plant metagenome]
MRAFLKGLATSLSIAAGYLPIAFSFGIAAVEAGLSPGMALLVSVLVYAGASQFILIALLTSGAGLVTAVATVWLMNARHVFYGPALATRLTAPGRLPTPLLAFGLTDEVFATAMSRIDAQPAQARESWHLGLQVGAYGAWVLGTALGTSLVGGIAHWPVFVQQGLTFVLPALFLALLLDMDVARYRVPIAAAAIAAVLLSFVLPSYNALALAILVGALSHAARVRA